MTLKLAVDGMTCGNCVNHVKNALASVTGVKGVDVNLEAGTATVTPKRGGVDVTELVAAVKEAGYEARAA